MPATDYLRIKVLPKSNRTEIVEIMADDTIKIRVKAAPEKGKANAELLKFLSIKLALPQQNLSIISGKTEQLKLIKVKRNESN